MAIYTTEELVRSFQKVARIRKGNKNFANDAGYWDGGRCEWGGSHNLKEDCETIANSFNKINSLKEIKEELQKCTSKNEYDIKKSNYIRKCDEILSGLQMKTGSASSMFWICIIWNHKDTNKTVESKVKVAREELQKLKTNLEKEDYKWVQEIKELNLEINKINQRMEENKRKAMKETDPVKKAALIQAIEEDGIILQQKYKKRKELGSKLIFNPDKYVSDLVEAMKKAIKRSRNKNKTPGSGGGNNNPTDPNASDSDDESSDDEDNNGNNGGERKKKDKSNFFQKNKQLILIGGIASLVIFYLYSQKNEPQRQEENYYNF